jgi:uncharacterized membrane protein
MSQTDYAAFEAKTPGDRTVMHVLYALHVLAPFTMWTLAIVAVIVNYLKRSDENDPLYARHHSFMIRTFWWALLWLVLTVPLWFLFVLPGWIAWIVVGCWYLYRYGRGWLRFNDNQPPP